MIKKQHYWPKGVPEEEMIFHMQIKEIDNVDEISNIICEERYHIMSLKYSDYAMLVMTTYGILDNLGGLDT